MKCDTIALPKFQGNFSVACQTIDVSEFRLWFIVPRGCTPLVTAQTLDGLPDVAKTNE